MQATGELAKRNGKENNMRSWKINSPLNLEAVIWQGRPVGPLSPEWQPTVCHFPCATLGKSFNLAKAPIFLFCKMGIRMLHRIVNEIIK